MIQETDRTHTFMRLSLQTTSLYTKTVRRSILFSIAMRHNHDRFQVVFSIMHYHDKWQSRNGMVGELVFYLLVKMRHYFSSPHVYLVYVWLHV